MRTTRFLKGLDAPRDLAEKVDQILRGKYAFDRTEIEKSGDGWVVAVTHNRTSVTSVVDGIATYVEGYYDGQRPEVGAWSWYEQEIFVRELKKLQDFTKACRLSMHEPDNENITAQVTGNFLDNAGGSHEFQVHLMKTEGDHVVTDQMRINLASLIALARMARVPDPCDERPKKKGDE